MINEAFDCNPLPTAVEREKNHCAQNVLKHILVLEFLKPHKILEFR